MSNELIRARKLIASVGSNLKRKKVLPAAQALHDAVLIVLKNPLMKAEKEEFGDLFDKAVYQLGSDKELRQHYPIKIQYEHGKEKELLTALKDIVKALNELFNEELQQSVELLETRKKTGFDEGKGHVDKGEYKQAKKVFDKLVHEFKHDTKLKSDIADLFIKADQPEFAFGYLDEAIKHDPNALFLYNRIGIVLRKMKDFSTAEEYYNKALELGAGDEYLHFNIGRLYIDWKKWDKVAESAEHALKINPEFTEAGKMLRFAQKKMGDG